MSADVDLTELARAHLRADLELPQGKVIAIQLIVLVNYDLLDLPRALVQQPAAPFTAILPENLRLRHLFDRSAIEQRLDFAHFRLRFLMHGFRAGALVDSRRQVILGDVRSSGVPIEMVKRVISLINIFGGLEGFLL